MLFFIREKASCLSLRSSKTGGESLFSLVIADRLPQYLTSAGTFSPRFGFLTSVIDTPEMGVAILAHPSNRVAPPCDGSRLGLVRRMASTRSPRIS